MIDMISAHAGTIGLVFFVSIFALVLCRIFRPGAKDVIESYKYIPIKGE